MRRIINFIKIIPYIIEGWTNFFLDLVSDIKYKKEFDERLEICRSCEKHSHGFCKVCGCAVVAKTKYEECECPIGKWSAINKNVKK